MNPIIADTELTKEIALALSGREGETLEGAYTLVVNNGMMIPQSTLCDAMHGMALHTEDRPAVKELFTHLLEEPWVSVEGLSYEQAVAAMDIWVDVPLLLSDALLMARAATGEVVWSRNKDVCDYYAKMMEETGHIDYLYLQGDPENDDPEAAEVGEEIAV